MVETRTIYTYWTAAEFLRDLARIKATAEELIVHQYLGVCFAEYEQIWYEVLGGARCARDKLPAEVYALHYERLKEGLSRLDLETIKILNQDVSLIQIASKLSHRSFNCSWRTGVRILEEDATFLNGMVRTSGMNYMSAIVEVALKACIQNFPLYVSDRLKRNELLTRKQSNDIVVLKLASEMAECFCHQLSYIEWIRNRRLPKEKCELKFPLPKVVKEKKMQKEPKAELEVDYNGKRYRADDLAREFGIDRKYFRVLVKKGIPIDRIAKGDYRKMPVASMKWPIAIKGKRKTVQEWMSQFFITKDEIERSVFTRFTSEAVRKALINIISEKQKRYKEAVKPGEYKNV